MNINTPGSDVAVVCGIFAIGNIFFGHFEEHTPKIRRVLKLVLFVVVVVLLSRYPGRVWAFGFLGLCLLAVVYMHGIVLPGKGINGWTGEPREKYYRPRRWERFIEEDKEKTGK
jgi:predicted MFS family arabinose efflux permease